MALIVPRPTTVASWLSRPSQAADAVRRYRRTPRWLRRPEPAMRVAAAVLVAWFGVLFVALGLHATKVGAPGWTVVGFNLAAVLGVVGLVVLLTRRAGAGGALIASMLILGQVVAVVSLF